MGDLNMERGSRVELSGMYQVHGHKVDAGNVWEPSECLASDHGIDENVSK
jgi:hypothetical protein